MAIFVIIPAYNSEASLGSLLRRVLDFVPKSGIIVVDDGSGDSTARQCLDLGIEPIRHPANLGKGQALRTGFTEAVRRGADAAITLDADGQNRPEHIPEFVKQFEISGCQITIGSRRQRFSELPLDRYLSNRLTTVVVSLLAGVRLEDSQSGYRLISAEAMRSVDTKTCRYQMESEFLIRAGRMGFRIGHLPIINEKSDTSHIRRGRDTLRFLAMALRMLWI